MKNDVQDEHDPREVAPNSEAQQSHLWFLESLDRINRAIQGSEELEHMMRDVLTVVLAIFNCDRVWLVYPCDPDAPSFRVPMEVTKPEYPGAKALNVEIPMFPDEAQNLREALASNAPVTYVMGTDRPVNKVSVEQFGVQSQMFTAIYPKSGKPWAFGMHQCSFVRVWTDIEKDLFQEVGRRLSDGLSSLLAYQTLQKGRERLDRSLNELRNLMDAIPEVVYVLDTDRNVVKWNHKAIVASGYSADELSHKLAFELISEHERPVMIEALNDAYDKGRIEFDAHLLKKDGTSLPYRWSAAPLKDEKGNEIGLIGIGWDLTKQLQGEEKVKTYEAQQRISMDAIPELIWIKDVNGVYLFVNRAFLLHFEKQREDVVGKTDFDIFPKEYAEKYQASDREVINSHTQKRMEEAAMDRVGNTIWVETIKTPAYDDTGKFLGVIGVARDVTGQKQLREALRRQEDLNAVISSHLPIGYAVNNISDGKAIFVNKKFEEIYGWPRDILTSVDAFFDHVYPDPEFREKIKKQVMADMMSGDPVRMVWEKLPIVRQTGEIAYVTARNIPLTEYDIMVSTVLDMTHQVKVEKALRESHRLQRAILDNIPDMAWVKDKNGVILAVNAAFASALHKSPESIIGKTDHDLWDDRVMADAFRADDEAVMNSGIQMRKQEYMIVPGTDQKVFAETIKMPIRNEDGTIFGTTGISRIVDEPQ